MELHELQRRLRAAGRTQTELAQRLGVTHAQVSRLLSGKTRMRVDVLRKIEAFLTNAEGDSGTRGVSETTAPFRLFAQGVTLEDARKRRSGPRMSAEDRERWLREIREIGEAGRRLPRITDMTDDEILGYDEMT